MILPPTVFHIRIVEGGRKKFNLWLPVILLWPLVILLMVLLAPLALIASLIWSKHSKLILAGPRLLALCWAIRGLQVRVQDDNNQVLIIID